MAETTQFTIGDEARCTDGVCGEMTRVVVDPVAQTVTHLVVEPKGRAGLARLVPLGLVDTSAGDVRLQCTLADFEHLDAAEETQFVPGSGGYAAYGPQQVSTWPYYGLTPGAELPGEVDLGVAGFSPTITYDRIPLGEVEVRRGDPVEATDGHIGHIQGLVVDPGDHHVTHVLLQEGHLWGRKDVAIPIKAVSRVGDTIRLNLSKHEVQDLPPVDFARHAD
ncbi:MAG TPA: PRC-barrel domain-containing protein [Streptosporangiaceae bacterium]